MSKSTSVSVLGAKSDTMPAHMQKDAGMGNEGASGALATPMIKLLQQLSPELRDVPGAKEGLLYNSVSKELFESLFIVPIYMIHTFTVWRDKKKGGGKFGDHETEAAALAHIQTLEGSADNYVAQETHKHYVLILDGDSGEVKSPAIIYMKSSQLGPSRDWNTGIHNSRAARFAKVWELGSKSEMSRNNETYANYVITDTGYWTPELVYEEAKALYQSISGKAHDEAEAA